MGAYAGPERNVSLQTTSGRSLYSLGVVQDGLVLNLDAGKFYSYPKSGNTWTDLTNNGRNGTLVNGVGYNSANGGSLVFDGVNDIVTTSYVSSNAFTWSAWFKTNGSFVTGNNYRNIICIREPNLMLLLMDTSSPYLGFWSSDGLYGLRLSTPIISNNTWYNVVFVREGNSITNGYKTYVNSVSYGSANTGVWNSSDFICLGGRAGSDQNLYGNISQALIYNRALTAGEVAQNYNATRSRFGI